LIAKAKPYRLFIREWIYAKSLNQKTVAERMECAPATLSRLINKRMGLTDKWLSRIAYVLDVEVTDLFRNPQELESFISIWDRIDPPQREQALKMLRSFK